MNRNMMKIVEAVQDRIPADYDMTTGELQELHKILHTNGPDGEFDVLSAAFCYGFALGAKAQECGKCAL